VNGKLDAALRPIARIFFLSVSKIWVNQEIGIAHGNHKPILPLILEQGLALPGFIKDLRRVAAFQNPQQAMHSLREKILRNSLTKQNQQAIGALAIGGLLILALVGMSKGS
jgi:hypothetical protein